MKKILFLLASLALCSTIHADESIENKPLSAFELVPPLTTRFSPSVQKLMLDGQYSAAAKTIDSILSDASLESSLETLDELSALAADLRISAAPSEANGCEHKILAVLAAESPTVDDIAYKLLKRAFYRGQYQMVCSSERFKNPSGRAAFSSYRFARLRARGAGAAYWQYFRQRGGAWPSEEEIVQYKQLAKTSTEFYEKALSQAPTCLDKARLANEWLPLNVNGYYQADSMALRAAVLPDHYYSKGLTKELLNAQAAELQKTALEVLPSSRQLSRLVPESQSQVARLLSAHYRELAVVGIPESVFDDLLTDMKSFLDIGLPIKSIRNNAEAFSKTLRWYLWQAIVTPPCDETDEQVIEHQVRTFGRILQHHIRHKTGETDLSPHPADEYESKWIGTYSRFKDNCFVPIYRRGMLRHRFQFSVDDVKKHCRKIYPSLPQKFDEHRKMRGESGVPTARTYKRIGRPFFVTAFFSFGMWAGPSVIDFPDRFIYTHRATLNKYGVYTHVPKKDEAFYPFPARKWFRPTTADD